LGKRLCADRSDSGVVPRYCWRIAGKEPALRITYVIVFVSDMSRSVSFYRDVIGLPLRFESPDWTEFATEGATFALHAGSAGPVGADGKKPAGSCRPGFSVPDLDEFHDRMVARNVTCREAPRPVFGARVAQYQDPDGLAFSVGESRAG
jgi:lactoylglutathione lyase